MADGTAHFEYAQRAPVDGVELLVDVSFRAAGEHLAIDLPGATALFTTRRGGVSEGPYASLNLGLLTDDDPDAVAANRERVRAQAGAGAARAGPPGARDAGRRRRRRAARRPTGRSRRAPGVAAIVLVADCLPVALAGPGAAGVVHAGWRGLAGGVLEAGVARRRRLAGRVAAAIGPGIGPCCYEVGDDVRAVFGTQRARRSTSRRSPARACRPRA